MKPTYATREFKIPAGGSIQTVRAADFLSCLSATHPFRVSFDNEPRVDFEAGLTYKTAGGFQMVEIINPNGEEMVARFGFGRGDIQDARLVLSGSIDAKPEIPGTLSAGVAVSVPTATTTAILAKNIHRREAILSNVGAATIYVGGNPAAGAAEGVPIAPGAGLSLEVTGALYARQDSGAIQKIHAAETVFEALV